MPEGPEIRIEADKIGAAITERRIEDAFFGLPRLKRYRAKVLGATVTGVATRGKAMLTRFGNGLTLYTHNQLYGRWYVRPRGELPRTNRSLRVALHTDTMSALLYSASEIALLDDAALSRHPYLLKLGPDVLDETLAWRDFKARLEDPKFARRSLGALYLDQSFIAGIGNYLRSEILFDARALPQRTPSSLTSGERSRLAKATVVLSRRAYRTRGVTNTPSRVAALKRDGAKRGGYRFAVFGRQGEPCYGCETSIRRIEVNGRRLYFCPSCQE